MLDTLNSHVGRVPGVIWKRSVGAGVYAHGLHPYAPGPGHVAHRMVSGKNGAIRTQACPSQSLLEDLRVGLARAKIVGIYDMWDERLQTQGVHFTALHCAVPVSDETNDVALPQSFNQRLDLGFKVQRGSMGMKHLDGLPHARFREQSFRAEPRIE